MTNLISLRNWSAIYQPNNFVSLTNIRLGSELTTNAEEF